MEQLNMIELLDRAAAEKSLMDCLKHFELHKTELTTKRGIYIYGNPGSGKTYFVKDVLRKLDYDVISFDAGDVRNKSIIETITRHNMSDTNILSLLKKEARKIAIIMDEIDGMNSGDKGGINSLIKLISGYNHLHIFIFKSPFSWKSVVFFEPLTFLNIKTKMQYVPVLN